MPNQEWPDVHDELNELLDKTQYWDRTYDFGVGPEWVMTPFGDAKYTPVMDQVNLETVETIFYDKFPDDVDSISTPGGHTLFVRAFEPDGSVTPAGVELEELMGALTEYPVLDDSAYSQREYDTHVEAIEGFISNILFNYDVDEESLGDSFELAEEIFDTLWNSDRQDSLEIEDSLGYLNSFVSEDDVEFALRELGHLPRTASNRLKNATDYVKLAIWDEPAVKRDKYSEPMGAFDSLGSPSEYVQSKKDKKKKEMDKEAFPFKDETERLSNLDEAIEMTTEKVFVPSKNKKIK